MLHTTLTGTLFIYQGQEAGMVNLPKEWDESEYKDVEAIQNLKGEREHLEKFGVTSDDAIKEVLASLRMTARDNSRTPMQVSSPGILDCIPLHVRDDTAICNLLRHPSLT